MQKFIISTDTTADLPMDFITEHHISVHPLHYLIDDKEYGMELGELSAHDFYETMRNGKMPTTNATIHVIDSLNATCGLNVLIRKLVSMQEQGRSLEECREWVEKTLPHTVCNFTLPDLFHMWRGGRLKKSSAILGTALKIQPVLHINNHGALEPTK